VQRNSSTTPPAPPAAATSSAPESAVAPSPAPVAVTTERELAPLPASSDPVTFARASARAVFEWDTTVPVDLAEYKGRLLVVADPTGEQSPGLVADLAAYLPSVEAWEHLRQYDTRQWLQITRAYIPDAWTEAIAADPDVVAPGTHAVTVTGVRHRVGVWDGQPVAARFDVAFTVFVVCEPTYPSCHLLRLTRLDKPLR
jgi:hypothetical protein